MRPDIQTLALGTDETRETLTLGTDETRHTNTCTRYR